MIAVLLIASLLKLALVGHHMVVVELEKAHLPVWHHLPVMPFSTLLESG